MAEAKCAKEFDKKLKTLKGQRTQKKGNITTRIKKLEELVDAGGSRRAMMTVMQGLLKVMDEIQQVCDEISNMTDEIDHLNCIDDIRVNVEVCVAMTTEHLDSRANEPASTETISWVEKHADMSRNGSEMGQEREQMFENVYEDRDVWPDRAGISQDNFSNSPRFSGGTGARQPNSEFFVNPQILANNKISSSEHFVVDCGRPLWETTIQSTSA